MGICPAYLDYKFVSEGCSAANHLEFFGNITCLERSDGFLNMGVASGQKRRNPHHICIFDLRGLYETDDVTSAGLSHFSVGTTNWMARKQHNDAAE